MILDRLNAKRKMHILAEILLLLVALLRSTSRFSQLVVGMEFGYHGFINLQVAGRRVKHRKYFSCFTLFLFP